MFKNLAFDNKMQIGFGGALLGGAALDILAGKQQAKATQAAAAAAQEAARFRPVDITTGLGTGAFQDLGGGQFRASTTLAPEYAAFLPMLRGQAAESLTGAPTLSPELAALGPQALRAAGGLLGNLGAFSPETIAASQFSKLEDLLRPTRERERQSLEARLLAQGRLGSTGGALSEQAFQEAVGAQQQRNLIEALQQGMLAQQQAASLGTQLGAFGQGIENLPLALQAQRQQLGLGALQAATGLEQSPLSLLELGGAFGGRQAAAGASAAPYIFQGAMARPTLTSQLLQGIGSALPGLAGAFPEMTAEQYGQQQADLARQAYPSTFGK